MGPPETTGPWDEFWRLTGDSAAFSAGTPQDEVLSRFWSAFFDTALAGRRPARVVDVGCGNGTLVGSLMSRAGRMGLRPAAVAGIDVSPGAVAGLRARHPGAWPVVADARRIPFRAHGFDIVVSQFGLEYAGEAGFREAARLVAPGGVLCAVVHLAGGPIHRECVASLAAVHQVRQAALLPAAKAAVSAARALAMGKGSRDSSRRAQESLLASLRRAGEALAGAGTAAAGGSLHRLHADVAAIHRRPEGFDEGETGAWADNMMRELDAYAARMAAMAAAALDRDGLLAVADRLRAEGLAVAHAGTTLAMGRRGEPGAWVLVGHHAQSS